MLAQLPSFCFVFRFDNDPKVIGVAHQRISAAYEACDPKLLVQQPSSLFKDFDVDRSQLSHEEKEERDAMDAMRDLNGSKEDESEKTRLTRKDLQRKLAQQSAADQTKWKEAELLDAEQPLDEEKAKKAELEALSKKKEMERLAKEEIDRKERERRAEEEERARKERDALLKSHLGSDSDSDE